MLNIKCTIKFLSVLAALQLVAAFQASAQQLRPVPDPFSRTTMQIDPADMSAISGDGRLSVVVPLHFRIGSSLLESEYMGNAWMLNVLDSIFWDVPVSADMDYVVITAAASPEGNTAMNEKLAELRAQAIKSYIMWRHPDADRDRIVAFSAGENWAGLRWMIDNDHLTPGREEALDVLDSQLSGDRTRYLLQHIAAGHTYKYITLNMFPYLRGGIACAIFFKRKTPAESIAKYVSRMDALRNNQFPVHPDAPLTPASGQEPDFDPVAPIMLDSVANVAPVEVAAPVEAVAPVEVAAQVEAAAQARIADMPAGEHALAASEPTVAGAADSMGIDTIAASALVAGGEGWIRKPLLAVKTNLLFDVATAMNVEVEIPIGRRWSIAGEYIFPWWLWEGRQYCLQTLSGNLEGRYWFGDREERPQLTGWFAGLYAGAGYYDFELGDHGYQGEFYIAAGLGGGYAHTINRSGTFRMEYSVGVGYLNTKYRRYTPSQDADERWHLIRRSSGNITWVGPTRARVSLVWMINGRSHIRAGEMKGGGR